MTPTTCHRCHAPVWTGPDDHVAAFDATVDPTPLTVSGECLAVLAGRTTYAVDVPVKRQSRHIWRRHPHRIGKPDPLAGTLHAAHVCYAPVPPEWAADPKPSDTSDNPTPTGRLF